MYMDDEKYIVSGPFTIDILKCDEVEESAKLLKHYFILAGSVPCVKEARVVHSGQLVDNKAWLPISKEDWDIHVDHDAHGWPFFGYEFLCWNDLAEHLEGESFEGLVLVDQHFAYVGAV